MAPTKVLATAVLLAAIALAGCTGPGGSGGPSDGSGGAAGDGTRTVYTHDWFYGPGYSAPDQNPVFRDAFDAADTGDLSLEVTWSIQAGLAAVNLTRPDGSAVNVTLEDRGAEGSLTEDLLDASGRWEVRIVTWRGDGGAFPEGQVSLRVTSSSS